MKMIMKRLYKLIDKMNRYILIGDMENARREQIAQKMIRRKFENENC